MANPQQADVIWCAGFFDGEGSVAAYVGGGPSRTSLVYKVCISQSDLNILNWIAETFGGKVYTKGQGNHLSKKTSYEVAWTGWTAYEFLCTVRSFLKVKADSVDDMIAIWENRLDREKLVVLIASRRGRRAAAETK